MKQTLALPTGLTDIDQSDVVTNAVSVSGDYVYSADGAAGISVYKKNSAGLLDAVGSFPLSGSSNYVKSAGDYIFVATGKGGLKIIKKLTVPSNSLNCTNFQAYPGDQYLNVNSGQTLNYQGSASVININVNANLAFCGSLAVSSGVNINSGGVFNMKGSFAQGNYNNPAGTPLIVNGTLILEGSVVLYGNMILNSGAKLIFAGDSPTSITIHGTVTKNSGVTITGNYIDTNNKLN